MKVKKAILLSILIIILVFSIKSIISIHEYSPPIIEEDGIIDDHIQKEIVLDELYTFNYEDKAGYIKFCTEKSVIYCETDYLTEDEIREYSIEIDYGIKKIESYLGISIDSERFINSRVFVVINSSSDSTSFDDADLDLDHTAIIYVDSVKTGHSNYLHELVHIIACRYGSEWIKEGLAVYLNDKLGGEPSAPNYGLNIDDLSYNLYNTEVNNSSYMLDFIGQNGFLKLHDLNQQSKYGILSGSFVKYLDDSLGTDMLMDIYNSSDTRQSIKDLTGNDIDYWKKEWLKSLTSGN